MTSVSLEMTDLFFKYPLLECSDLKGKVLFIITFNELIRDAYNTIHELYDNLGINITDEFERFLLNSQSMVSNHKTKNKYDPEQFGLTPEMFRKRFAYIYRDFPDLTT